MKFWLLSIEAVALLMASSCAAKRVLPENANVILTHEDPRVGTYVSSERGFDTSSYWIEGPTGLVLIDTQFLLSAGDEALAWAENATGKKVVLAIVLHPNPDKFNGTNQLKARGIPVVTSEQVKALIPEVHKDRHHWFHDRYKPDYPNALPLPDSFGDKTRELDVAGLKLIARVLGGPGCSGAHVVVEWDRHIFTGDLVTNLNHSWLEIGEVDAWLERIQEILTLQPKAVHPGRGPSGGPELLERQRSYLQKVKAYVLAEKPAKRASEEAKRAAIARIAHRLMEEYPGYGLPYFIRVGLPEVWDKYAK